MRSSSVRKRKHFPFLPGDLLYRPGRIFSDFLFPPKCLVCGIFFQPPENDNARDVHWEGPRHGTDGIWPGGIDPSRFLAPFLCPGCISGLTAAVPPICACCGIMFKVREGDDHLCGECITAPKNFNMARAAFVYDQIVMDVIHGYKYKGKIQLAGPLGKNMLTAFMKFWDNHLIDFIMPVPLHNNKFRQRGFNQSYLLVKNWKKLWAGSNDKMPSFAIAKNALKRIRPTAPQTGLGRADRLSNIKGAFAVDYRGTLESKKVLLVDDVYTTGATVNECARVLLGAGVQSVDVLTLARAH